MKQFTPEPEVLSDRALGALLGACIGDAAGATLEFIGRRPTEEEVEHAISLPGGGVFKLAPGQFTDDGELTLCLAHSLAESSAFSIERVARQYAGWVESQPFDIGQTTRSALGCFQEREWKSVCRTEGYATAMSRAAYSRCMMSKANGSLMRSSPLGIWGWRLNPNDLALLAMEDSALSHPNNSCRHAVACYSIAIAQILRGQGRAAAFEIASDWAELNANAEVRQWLEDARRNLIIPSYPQAGFVRIGFTHAFRHLLLGSDYVEAIREVLSGGGDTDTNACIVGGLVGAACGAVSIPDSVKLPVLNCDTSGGKQTRPGFLRGSAISELVARMLARAPGWST
ncbi:MAG TPA: ADP-ribosylglycohydrolase family protein [Blastocatellia bacterium]|nr:ADP-ribosylglycohydrolase family protein [Blastocatellia bacterium]